MSPRGLPPGAPPPPSGLLAPSYVYAAARREVVAVSRLGSAPLPLELGVARVNAPMTGPWNVSLSGLTREGGPAAANGQWNVQRSDISRAILRWGTNEAAYEAVLDWWLGCSTTVWGSFVDVTWLLKSAGAGVVVANIGNQALAVSASVQPGSGPGHPSHRRPCFTQEVLDPTDIPVPRFARWAWLQPVDQPNESEAVFLDETNAVLARYQLTDSGAATGAINRYIDPLPVPHFADHMTVTDVQGATFAVSFELELG